MGGRWKVNKFQKKKEKEKEEMEEGRDVIVACLHFYRHVVPNVSEMLTSLDQEVWFIILNLTAWEASVMLRIILMEFR